MQCGEYKYSHASCDKIERALLAIFVKHLEVQFLETRIDISVRQENNSLLNPIKEFHSALLSFRVLAVFINSLHVPENYRSTRKPKSLMQFVLAITGLNQ